MADLVLHLQCINIQKSNTEPQQRSHTLMSNITKEEQGKKFRPEKYNVKKQTKKTNYKYLPCWNLNKWKGDQHSIQKYHNFIYQMASIGSCSGLHSYKEMLIDRISIFFPSFHPRLPLAVPIVQRTMHSCIWPVLSSSGFVNHLFFTLQNYNSIHIFSSLMLFFFTLKYYNPSIPYIPHRSTLTPSLRLQNLFSALKEKVWGGGETGGWIEQINACYFFSTLSINNKFCSLHVTSKSQQMESMRWKVAIIQTQKNVLLPKKKKKKKRNKT